MTNNLPKLNDLDRINLQELITDPRYETLQKLATLMKERWRLEIQAMRIPGETEFDYIWRQATRESKGEALNEFLLMMGVESWPEEREPNEPKIVQQGDIAGS